MSHKRQISKRRRVKIKEMYTMMTRENFYKIVNFMPSGSWVLVLGYYNENALSSTISNDHHIVCCCIKEL